MQNMLLLDSAASLWCRDNQKQEPGGGFWGCWVFFLEGAGEGEEGVGWGVGGRAWMKSSCQIVFDALCVGESRRLLRCPPGSGEQSGFGISHSLNSQGLWPSADSAANSSLIPSPLLFGQLWIFERRESNSVRHATVQPHSVSAVVWTTWRGDLARTSPLFFFADHIRCQKLTVRWPKYNILDTSLFPRLRPNKIWYRRALQWSPDAVKNHPWWSWACSSFQISAADASPLLWALTGEVSKQILGLFDRLPKKQSAVINNLEVCWVFIWWHANVLGLWITVINLS